MKKLEIFQNKSFGRIRTLAINNEPWFVGKDVAEILGYAKPENAIANHVDEEDKTSTLIQGSGSNYKSKASSSMNQDSTAWFYPVSCRQPKSSSGGSPTKSSPLSGNTVPI
mgnify:CR=1 FL=1